MSNRTQYLDYSDFEAIVRSARMERSVAVGDAIAGLLAAILSGLTRASAAARSGLSGKIPHTPAGAGSSPGVAGHR